MVSIRGFNDWSVILNHFYKNEPGLYQYQFEHKGFEWIDYADHENSVIAYQRQADKKEDLLIVICNFTPETRRHYRVGVPYRGQWKEAFNSDDVKYAGSGVLNEGSLITSPCKISWKRLFDFVNFAPAWNFYTSVREGGE